MVNTMWTVVDRQGNPVHSFSVSRKFVERPVVGDEFESSDDLLEKGIYTVTRVIHTENEVTPLTIHATKNREPSESAEEDA